MAFSGLFLSERVWGKIDTKFSICGVLSLRVKWGEQQKSKIITESLLGITTKPILVNQAYFRKEPKMKKSLTLLLLVCILLATMTFTGCKKKGPLESAGKAVDKAAQTTSADAQKAAADAKKAADEAAKKATDEAKKAADEAKKAADEAAKK